MGFAFGYKLTGTGWAEVTFADKVSNAAIRVSYLSNALRSILEITARLAEGLRTAECSFDDEPERFVLTVTRIGTEVDISIRAFPDDKSTTGEEIFTSRTRFVTFLKTILQSADALVHEIPPDEYRRRWVQHPFPTQELERLRAGIQAINDSDEIELLTAAEHVRRRPKMYFEHVNAATIVARLLHDFAYGLCMDRTSSIFVTFHPDGGVEVSDDVEGIPNEDRQGRARIVDLLSECTVPDLDERFYLSSIPPLCKEFTVNTVSSTGQQRGEFHYGVPTEIRVEPTVTTPLGTTFRFQLDPNYLESSELSEASVLGALRRQFETNKGGWKDEMEQSILFIDLRAQPRHQPRTQPR
jgi:hypothetical protein